MHSFVCVRACVCVCVCVCVWVVITVIWPVTHSWTIPLEYSIYQTYMWTCCTQKGCLQSVGNHCVVVLLTSQYPQQLVPGGDYYCDVPMVILNNLFKHLADIKDQFDWVYWTGDLPAHNIWNQTREDQMEILSTVTTLMASYLENKIVYPTLGNHESAPVNRYSTMFHCTQLILHKHTLEYY